MTNVSTTYLGLKLDSPLIVSSSGLTGSPEKIRKFEQMGAGAVVLKSLFEEQINYEAGAQIENDVYPEAYDYITGYTRSNSVEEYLRLIESAKKAVRIPVMASINCMSSRDWISFAKDIESAGADALELNIFYFPGLDETSSDKIENLYYDVLLKVREVTQLPLAIKIGYHFTNLPALVNNLYVRGAKGVVLFNRFYEPDIDVETLKITTSHVFSTPADIRQSLRWVGIVAGRVDNLDIAASTGVHDGIAVIKQILAGARVVQLCSVLYRNGAEELQVILQQLKDWMERKKYDNLDAFRGKLSSSNISDPSVYERSQFMKYFSSYQ